MIISRGDSTLRGHYPLETQLLADGLTKSEGAVVDGEIICPFFPEGGRYTMDNIHYVKEQDNLVPAGMTEFAKDKTFGYKSSDLTEYVEEKTAGKYKKEDCITISLEELNALDIQGIKAKLISAKDMAKIIVNAVSYADLKVFCAALVLAMKEGKHYMARTAAAFTKVMGRVSGPASSWKSTAGGCNQKRWNRSDRFPCEEDYRPAELSEGTGRTGRFYGIPGKHRFRRKWSGERGRENGEGSRGKNPFRQNRCNLYK